MSVKVLNLVEKFSPYDAVDYDHGMLIIASLHSKIKNPLPASSSSYCLLAKFKHMLRITFQKKDCW